MSAPIGSNAPNQPLPLEIGVQQVKKLLDASEEVLLLDCRQPQEHQFCAIEGSVLIPTSEILDRQDELEPYRDKRIIVHCHHGVRSLRVVQWLRGQGFESSQSMAHGIDAWSQEIDSAIPRY